MPCLKKIQNTEIFGSKFSSRTLTTNEDISVYTFKAVVKNIIHWKILEIPGVKNAGTINFDFSQLQTLKKSTYHIEYWGDFGAFGNEPFLLEEFYIVSAENATNCTNSDNLNFEIKIEEISIPVTITKAINNFSLNIDNLTPEQIALIKGEKGEKGEKGDDGSDANVTAENIESALGYVTQGKLTEDNVGEFMDLELATKSAPTSGDTVLGRDSVTGKAVEIPTSSLGGGGSVDTSNLVPYTGATQDVNIGTHYFESSAGFKTTNGTPNKALTADGGTFNLNTKADLVSGKIPDSQLPSYVDDVLEYANLASFPATGESGKIYIAIDTNLTYRWGGSSYVVMSSSLALGETSSTAYRGDIGKIAYDHSQVTHDKTLVGLGNVDNTSDLNKPISTATQTALNLKENVANKATDLLSPDNTKYPTTLAVANENKKATITVELISQLTTNFYAPNALRINSTALISGSGTLTLKVNDVAYTLTDLIPQGAKITAETTSQSVYNLISVYE